MIPKSFIKDVAFELPDDFTFDHSPWEENKHIFIGRTIESDKFVSILKKSKDKKGVYLVTGYRGMGKTSFVNKVIKDYDVIKENKKADIVKINVHISPPNTKEIDVLRQITSRLRNEIYERSVTRKKIGTKKKQQSSVLNWLFFTLILCWLFPYIGLHLKYDNSAINSILCAIATRLFRIVDLPTNDIAHLTTLIKYIFFLTPLIFLAYFFILSFTISNIVNDDNDPYILIKKLFERAYSNISREKTNEVDITGPKSIVGKINLFREKEVRSYPLASPKELEEEILYVLRKLNDSDKNKSYLFRPMEIIFIFDELDKVNIRTDKIDMYDDLDKFKSNIDYINANIEENRSRKGLIINILGNLKSFLTQAHARFIFIAGREMFDASLADVSDRQSLLSSIFNNIFYLNSFLKENSGENLQNNNRQNKDQYGITDLIEEYLVRVLTNTPGMLLSGYFKDYIKHDINRIDETPTYALNKTLFVLQRLIVYLAYRSNGSPKKLQKSLESFFVVKDGKANTFDYNKFIVIKNPLNKSNKNHKNPANIAKKVLTLFNKKRPERKIYLVIGYNEQYRIGFINHLFRPYIINKSNYLKSLSDNTLVTTSYVMDHLIKFHPFAFSMHNLEQIPEVISENSTQAFRGYIQSLLDYLAKNHVRETHINLFSHKFISKSENELTYITLKYEEEAAAFNFTLDETYQVKLRIRTKIKELRSIFLSAQTDNKQIYSISFLNSWLGDTHFFDQQYDDAITSYSDAIKEITVKDFKHLNFRDFSLLHNLKLKQGLCLEKTKSYQDAISFYMDAINNAKGFIRDKISGELNNFSTSAINDLMQSINQSFIAKAYMQEKIGLAGFDDKKANHNLKSFQELLCNFSVVIPCNNYLTLANYMLNIGNLLYYKNSTFSTEDIKGIFDGQYHFRHKKIFSGDRIVSLLSSVSSKTIYPSSLTYYATALVCLKRYYTYDIMCEPSKSRIDNNECQSYDNEEDIFELFNVIQTRTIENKYAKKILAAILSSLGNTFVQEISSQKGIIQSSIKKCFELTIEKPDIDCDSQEWEEWLTKIKNHVTADNSNMPALIMSMYLMSSDYYKKAGAKLSESFQLRKVLYLIRTIITNSDLSIDPEKDFMKKIDSNIVKPLFKLNSEISDVADKKQYQKYLMIMGIDYDNGGNRNIPPEEKEQIDLSLSNNPADMEVWLLRSHIKITLKNEVDDVDKRLVNNYNSISTQYSRVGEMLFEEKRCYTEIKDKIRTQESIPIDLVIDHLFACLSVIRISNVLRTNSMISNSLIGYMYYKVGLVIENYVNTTLHAEISDIIDILADYLKELPYTIHDKNFYYKNAKLYFERAISLHNQGKEYEKKINEMAYLEDDYNDSSNHFGLALERYYIYSGVITDRIKEIDEKLKVDVNQIFYEELQTH